ncbi:MAG: HAMP domain-containing protein [Gammaproteobacteria bacterium]|nr:MAG: HAMP domain-containing protein [Gammaproteobacteria bacterium]
MLNKIYFRFFLGFLGTVFLVLGIFSGFIYFQFAPNLNSQTSPIVNAMDSWEKIIKNGGADSFKDHIRNNPLGNISSVYLLDANGREISQRSLPPPAQFDINNFIQDKETTEFKSNFMRIKKIKDININTWYLVGMPTKKHFENYTNNPPHKILMLLIAMVILCGIICLLLAIYLTKPISVLHNATNEIVQGVLNTKIDPNICNRNDELGSLATAFNKMTERLHATQSEQKKLLRNISHELRSPLARAGIAIDLAIQKEGTTSKELERIETEIYRLNDLIGQILKLPTLGESFAHTFDDTIELNSLIKTICDDASFEAQNKNIKIIFNSADKQLPIKTTGNLLHSAIENIIRNSLKYSPPNGKIEVNLLDHHQEHYVIEVSDQGPGIREEHLEKIFTPFHRVYDNSRDTQQSSEGFGLGLAISHGAITLHEGEIKAHNIYNANNSNNENNHERCGLKITIQLPKKPT